MSARSCQNLPGIVALILFAAMSHCCAQPAAADEDGYVTEENILYRSGNSLTEYMQERCRLDLYYPKNSTGFSTVVWFHGGGLKAGNRFVPEALREQGIAVVAVNYRLSPKVRAPAWIEDGQPLSHGHSGTLNITEARPIRFLSVGIRPAGTSPAWWAWTAAG